MSWLFAYALLSAVLSDRLRYPEVREATVKPDDEWMAEHAEWLFVPYSGPRRKPRNYGWVWAIVFTAAAWGCVYLALRAWWLS